MLIAFPESSNVTFSIAFPTVYDLKISSSCFIRYPGVELVQRRSPSSIGPFSSHTLKPNKSSIFEDTGCRLSPIDATFHKDLKESVATQLPFSSFDALSISTFRESLHFLLTYTSFSRVEFSTSSFS